MLDAGAHFDRFGRCHEALRDQQLLDGFLKDYPLGQHASILRIIELNRRA